MTHRTYRRTDVDEQNWILDQRGQSDGPVSSLSFNNGRTTQGMKVRLYHSTSLKLIFPKVQSVLDVNVSKAV